MLPGEQPGISFKSRAQQLTGAGLRSLSEVRAIDLPMLLSGGKLPRHLGLRISSS